MSDDLARLAEAVISTWSAWYREATGRRIAAHALRMDWPAFVSDLQAASAQSPHPVFDTIMETIGYVHRHPEEGILREALFRGCDRWRAVHPQQGFEELLLAMVPLASQATQECVDRLLDQALRAKFYPVWDAMLDRGLAASGPAVERMRESASGKLIQARVLSLYEPRWEAVRILRALEAQRIERPTPVHARRVQANTL
jgi:hypothetical protein